MGDRGLRSGSIPFPGEASRATPILGPVREVPAGGRADRANFSGICLPSSFMGGLILKLRSDIWTGLMAGIRPAIPFEMEFHTDFSVRAVDDASYLSSSNRSGMRELSRGNN